MQVSTVCANNLSITELPKLDLKNTTEPTDETSLKTFTSSLIKYDSDEIENINEWKTFCENQIIKSNLDYLA